MIRYLPNLPYLVLDQNECRNRKKAMRLFRRCKQRNLKILLADVAIYEFSNVRRPDVTWRRSLEYLCFEPSLVVVGRSIGEMMKEEILTGKPITNIMDKEGTKAFQNLLSELRDNDEDGLEKALANVKRIIGNEKRKRNIHKWKKAIVTKRRDSWQKSLPKSYLAILRSNPDKTVVRLLADLGRAAFIREQAMRDKCSGDAACALAVTPGVYSHAISALDALALDWLAKGGLDGVKPESITNDWFDMDYIVTATFCSGLLTKDKRVKRTYKALTKALERRYCKIDTALKRAREKQATSLATGE